MTRHKNYFQNILRCVISRVLIQFSTLYQQTMIPLTDSGGICSDDAPDLFVGKTQHIAKLQKSSFFIRQPRQDFLHPDIIRITQGIIPRLCLEARILRQFLAAFLQSGRSPHPIIQGYVPRNGKKATRQNLPAPDQNDLN